VPALHVIFILAACLMLQACGRLSSGMEDGGALIAPLINPAKLATLGKRGANQRLQKAEAILWQSKHAGHDPQGVAADAVRRIGWDGTDKGELTVDSLLRNLTILERLGSTTTADIGNMRHGMAPTVRRGPYENDILSVDHIIPRSVCPELDNVIANLEFMPLAINREKSARIGLRQIDVARRLRAAGLLTKSGLRSVLTTGEAHCSPTRAPWSARSTNRHPHAGPV
jgi:hypothetical protein